MWMMVVVRIEIGHEKPCVRYGIGNALMMSRKDGEYGFKCGQSGDD